MESNGNIRLASLTKSDVGKFVRVTGMLSDKQMATKKNNEPYLKTTIMDKKVSMEVPIWDQVAIDKVNEIEIGDVVLVQGTVSVYNEAMQIQARSFQSLGNEAASEYITKIVHSAAKRKSFGGMLGALPERYKIALKSLFEIEEESSLFSAFSSESSDVIKKFMTFPCSVKHHMNVIGGGFEHTIGVVQNVMILADMLTVDKPLLPGCTLESCGLSKPLDESLVCDKDMLIFLATVHDFDKMMEYVWDGAIRHRTNNYLRHDTMMIHTLSPHLQKAGFTYDECAKMYLCLLTHHGEFGDFQPKRKDALPVEAKILHYADYLDTMRDDLVDAKIKEGDENDAGSQEA